MNCVAYRSLSLLSLYSLYLALSLSSSVSLFLSLISLSSSLSLGLSLFLSLALSLSLSLSLSLLSRSLVWAEPVEAVLFIVYLLDLGAVNGEGSFSLFILKHLLFYMWMSDWLSAQSCLGKAMGAVSCCRFHPCLFHLSLYFFTSLVLLIIVLDLDLGM